jgi:hypothetical protein
MPARRGVGKRLCQAHREVMIVKRFRWVVVGLIGVALAGAVTAGVMARSSATAPGVLGASSFSSTGAYKDGWYWLTSTRQQATWTFADVSALQFANRYYVWLNFKGQATNTLGGYGFGSQLRIVVQGVSSGTLMGQLVNSWKPHIADPAVVGGSHGVGWDVTGAMNLPPAYWIGARQVAVTVSLAELNRQVAVNEDSLHIGYFVP